MPTRSQIRDLKKETFGYSKEGQVSFGRSAVSRFFLGTNLTNRA